jgi:tryptophan synthase beta chain
LKSLGKFGKFGGMFVPEILYTALEELEEAFIKFKDDENFNKEFQYYLKNFAGRETPLYFAKNLSKKLGFKLYLKREDLVHGGSHKLNNTIGQALLAKKMGKKHFITETAAGQQGVATVMAGNAFGLKTKVFMGLKDTKRQTLNAERIKLLGGEVIPVTRGHQVLKDAVDEALVEWIVNNETSHYVIGSAVGPHPYPTIVRHFQSIIGKEIKSQIMESEGKLPNKIIACGSGGSNALGAFYEFIDDEEVELIFVEGGGKNAVDEKHAAAFFKGSPGVFQGAMTYMLQDEFGMDSKTESRATGLNYPARGPELSYLKDKGRMKTEYATDEEVLVAFQIMSKEEGILPAFETSHAIAYLLKLEGKLDKDEIVVLNFSGRGDKDVQSAINLLDIKV